MVLIQAPAQSVDSPGRRGGCLTKRPLHTFPLSRSLSLPPHHCKTPDTAEASLQVVSTALHQLLQGMHRQVQSVV
jgi:hypothetical protein